MSKTTPSTNKGGRPKGTASKKAAKPSAHPSWVDMIKECVVAHPEDARTGVSRPTIKKFVETRYKLSMDASHTSQLSRAILSGSEKGTFVLPKGPSGKVKLAPKAKAETVKEMNKAEKENKKATKATPANIKKSTSPKKTLATSVKENNKPATARSSGGKPHAPKKTVAKAQSKTISKTVTPKPAKRPTAKTSAPKKSIATKAKPAAKKSSSKKNDAKKAAAKTAASKPRKLVSRTKPTSKATPATKKPASTKSTKPASAAAKPASAGKA